MKTIRWLGCLALLAVLGSGCSTPYQKDSGWNVLGGVSDRELEPGVYSISFRANAYTSRQRVALYTLYRCAEVTKEKGSDYFAFLRGDTKTAPVTVPTGGGGSYTVPAYHGNAVIRIFKGEKPADYPDAILATEVLEKFAHEIKRDAGSTFMQFK